jgi:hypothetical protein
MQEAADLDDRMLFYESKGMWAESIKMQRGLLKQARKAEDMKGQIQVFPHCFLTCSSVFHLLLLHSMTNSPAPRPGNVLVEQ